MAAPVRRRRAVLEDIEPRILYAADHPAAAAAVPLLAQEAATVAPAEARPEAAEPRDTAELVFIDERVPDADVLIADVSAQAAAGRHIEVVRIGAGDDGIALISSALAERSNVGAVHVIAHGSSGSLALGNTTLDQDALLLRAGEIAAWGGHLTADADLLLYGCDVASQVDGQTLVEGLAQLTGADVAASDNLTGAAGLGGDWVLEVHTGAIEAASAIDAAGEQAFDAVLATYTVTNTADSGAGSLREAITNANSNGGTDNISFNIAGTSVHTITLASALPSITGTVVIDGSTDDSFAANGSKPAIVIDGSGLNAAGLQLTASADGSTIRGLVVRNFGDAAVRIDAGSDGSSIVGNYLGAVDATGNLGSAIAASYTLYIQGSNNVVGGSTAADRNVMGTNGAGGVYGVFVSNAGATGNQFLGNYIGIGADGSTVLGGDQPGIVVFDAAATRIEGNVLAVGADNGVYLNTAGAGTVVANNLIGTNAAGTALVSTPTTGIWAAAVGSNTVFSDNVIGGASAYGIRLDAGASGVTVQGNRIGTDAAGTANWGTSSSGIANAGSNNLFGGTGAGQGNTIAFSNQGGGSGDAITLSGGTGNAVLGNAIYSTASPGLGIDLGASGVTANDAGDADTGANNLQNFPVLTLVKTDGSSQVDIRGSLNSTAGSYFRLEFFAEPANGSSASYLGSLNVATDGSGNASFANTFAAAVPVGYTITATATRSNAGYSTFIDTSEFSAALDAGTTPVNTVPGAKTVTEDVSGAIGGLSVVDGGVLAMTTSLSVLHGAVTVSLAGGATIGSGANGSATLTLSGTAAQVNAALATLNYLGNANYNGSDTLTVLSTDASTLSDSDTVAITVTAVNDAPVLAAIAPTLTSVTEDQTANSGQTVASFLGSAISDVDSGAVQGVAITGLNSGTGTWQYSTNGGSSWSAVGAVSGSSALLLRSTDYLRFVPNGQNATSGSITYRAWDQTSGSAGTKVDASTNGGATAFSTATDTASITVTAVNDAPVLTAIAPTLTTINEDATTNSGQTVASFVGASITDVDTGAVQGIAITGLISSTGTWQYSTNGGSSWSAVGAVSGSSALLLRSTDSIRFVPDGQNATTGSITYRAWDQTSGTAGSKVDASTGGGTTAFSTATDTASITVTAVNDAPVLTPATPTLTTITEDQTNNSGQTVASFIGSSIADVDSGALQGIAITALASGNGTWQYSTDGGSTWNSVGAISGSSALLLRSTDSIRFVPNGQNATIGSITYRAWDQTSGSAGTKVDASTNGSTTAFSTASDTASITITAVNDAPVLTANAPTLTTINEDATTNSGQTVASFLGASIADVDTGAVQGIAITGLVSNTGTWQYSTDAGSSWSAVGTVSGSSALLLRSADFVRFVPDGQNATTGSITYRAWDQTSGSAGSKVDASTNGGATAFSTASDTASITVTTVNDGPVLTAFAPTLTTITEDQTNNSGQTVASFIGSSITDVDTGAVRGIAITGLTSGTSTWQYSTDGGSTWNNVGAVSGSSALLLRSTDSVRFVPDGQNATTGSMTYRAWDQTSGSAGNKVDASSNGGISAFSTATDTASITVAAVNDAPVLTPAAPALTTITEDQTSNAGQTVASFIGSSITDADTGATQGVAITGLTSGTGSWQYSTDGGSTWNSVGAVSGSSALLLRSTDSIRFVPNGQNATTGSITYRAWDQTSASAGNKVDASINGGTTAFSTSGDTASITVTAVNDAPVLTAIAPTLASITEDQTTNIGQTVASFIGSSINDVDTGAVQGIAITSLTSGTGTWQYSTDGGSTWNSVGAVSASSALLLRSTDSVRFVPNEQNATTGFITYRAWDQTSGSAGSQVDASTNGGTTAFSTATDTAAITVTSANDAPRGANNVVTTLENTTYTFTAADFGFSDPIDSPPDTLAGVKLTSLPSAGSLRLNGTAVAAGQTVSVAEIGAGLLRFQPAPDAAGAAYASFTFQVQDDGGTANGGADLDPTPRTMTVDVTPANHAPTITSHGGGATASVGVAENSIAVTTVTASDVDLPAQSLRYTIVGGADAARFTIDAVTGVLRFATAPDFESPADVGGNNVYEITVQASDGSLTASQALSITVTDVDEHGVGPVRDADTAADAVAENAATGSLVGITAQAVDPDGTTNTVTYALTDNAGGRFAIDAATGVVTVADGALLDFGAATSHGLTVLATSADGSTSTQRFSVTVTEAEPPQPPRNTAPVITSLGGAADAGVAVPENSSIVTTVTAVDADTPPQTLAYSLAGGVDAALFTLDVSTGLLRFVQAPDAESPRDAGHDNVYEVVVRVSDGSASATQAIAVTVTNVNESQLSDLTDADAGPNIIASRAVGGGPVGITALAVDTNPAAVVSYRLVDDAGGRFAIDAATGVVTVADSARLASDAPGAPYRITVRAADAEGSVRTASFSVTLPDDEFRAPPQGPAVSAGVSSTTTAAPFMPFLPSGPTAESPAASGPASSPAPTPSARPGPAEGSMSGPDADALSMVSPGPLLPYEANRHGQSLPAPADGLTEHRAIAPGRADDLAEALARLRSASGSVRRLAEPALELESARSGMELPGGAPTIDAVWLGSTALSLGVAIWATRGGALLTSMLATTPAWQNFDPVPVLRRQKQDRGPAGRQQDAEQDGGAASDSIAAADAGGESST